MHLVHEVDDRRAKMKVYETVSKLFFVSDVSMKTSGGEAKKAF